MKKSLFLVTLLTLLLYACKDDDSIILDPSAVNDLVELKTLLNGAFADDELIRSVNDIDQNYLELEFEDKGAVKVYSPLVQTFTIDEDQWKITFTLEDASSVETWYLGNDTPITINTITNTSGNSPLTSETELSVPVNGKISIRVEGQDGEASMVVADFEDVKTEHTIPVLGLYPDFENTITYIYLSKTGKPRKEYKRSITTEPLPDNIPEFEIVQQYASSSDPAFFLVNFRPTGIPLIVDQFGKVRWYSTGFSVNNKYGLQRFANGNMAFGKAGDGQGSIFEYTMLGEMVNEYSSFPEFESIHHDVYEMPDGNLLVTANKVGEDTVEDHIILLDRNTSEITNIWDLREILPRRDTLWNTPNDWLHINAVTYDERDNSIIISGQRQGLFKISWDNKLEWILAPPYDWDGFEDYLLTSSDPNMEWNWGQHAPEILPNGNLFFFDNGFGRGFGTSPKFSRAVEMKITEAERGGTVETIWEYGRERGEDYFSPIISDVDFIADSNSRLVISGSRAFDHEYINNNTINNAWNNENLKATITEVDENKTILFEMNVRGDIARGSVYRAEKIGLY